MQLPESSHEKFELLFRGNFPSVAPIKEDESFKLPPAHEEDSNHVQSNHVDFGDTLHSMASEATLDEKFWSSPGSAGFHVRGRRYMKVWDPSDLPLTFLPLKQGSVRKFLWSYSKTASIVQSSLVHSRPGIVNGRYDSILTT